MFLVLLALALLPLLLCVLSRGAALALGFLSIDGAAFLVTDDGRSRVSFDCVLDRMNLWSDGSSGMAGPDVLSALGVSVLWAFRGHCSPSSCPV